MEHAESHTHFEEFETLQITSASRDYLQSAAKWSRILAILGFIGIGFLVLVGFGMMVASSFVPMDPTIMPIPLTALGIMYLVIGIFYLMPLLYLWRFAGKTDKALANHNTGSLEEALMNLRSFFRYIGIFSLAIIALYILVLIGAAVVGAFA